MVYAIPCICQGVWNNDAVRKQSRRYYQHVGEAAVIQRGHVQDEKEQHAM